MKFSIITCNRNNEKWIQKHIESVKNQTFTDYEHIIIDDASTDKSIDVIKDCVDRSKTEVFVRKQRRRCWLSERNQRRWLYERLSKQSARCLPRTSCQSPGSR